MKKIFISAVVLLCLLTMASCGSKEGSATNDETAVSEAVNVTTTEAEDVYAVETPYCTLSVPGEYRGNVKSEVITQEPYVLAFKSEADDTLLFSLSFDAETDNVLGTLELDDRNVVIYVSFSDFDEDDANYEKYSGFQSGINTVIEHLKTDYNFTVGEAVPREDPTTFDIETSVVTMKYPNKWKDKITVDVTEESVNFSYNYVKIFDLSFVDCDGFLLGTYNGTPIYIVDHSVDDYYLTDEELSDIYAMQQDVNVIIDNLKQDSNFKVSE